MPKKSATTTAAVINAAPTSTGKKTVTPTTTVVNNTAVTKPQKGGKVAKGKTVEPTVVNVVPEPVVVQEAGKPTKNASKKRTFKIKLSDSEFCSRITGNTPKQAASKALTLIVNQKKQGGKVLKGKIIFTIKETTRGSKGKEYTYQGEKVKLDKPTTYKIRSPNGDVKEIINRFRNVIEKFQD